MLHRIMLCMNITIKSNKRTRTTSGFSTNITLLRHVESQPSPVEIKEKEKNFCYVYNNDQAGPVILS